MIFINDIDEGIINRIFKFADDTKLLGTVSCTEDIEQLQKDLDKLLDWSQKWQMSFNKDKCKVMHIGYGNKLVEYVMDGSILQAVEEEKDLGVIVNRELKVAKQCAAATKKGYQTLGLISRTFTNKGKSLIIRLYKSLVRPHLDYCIQAWRPHLQKDIDMLEKVQRRATRMAAECGKMEYKDRLRITNLTTLETRRLRADLVEVYKILNGKEGIKENIFLKGIEMEFKSALPLPRGVIQPNSSLRDPDLIYLSIALAIES